MTLHLFLKEYNRGYRTVRAINEQNFSNLLKNTEKLIYFKWIKVSGYDTHFSHTKPYPHSYQKYY